MCVIILLSHACISVSLCICPHMYGSSKEEKKVFDFLTLEFNPWSWKEFDTMVMSRPMWVQESVYHLLKGQHVF